LLIIRVLYSIVVSNKAQVEFIWITQLTAAIIHDLIRGALHQGSGFIDSNHKSDAWFTSVVIDRLDLMEVSPYR